MTRVWSDRPHFMHLSAFFAAYVLGCGFAEALAIIPDTGISIWPASGLFIATLAFTSRQSWPWWIVAGLLAELSGNLVWFHNPLPVAMLIFAGNTLEAMAGAWLVRRFDRPIRLESLQEVLALTALAGIAPLVSATVNSATLAWFGIQSFATAWPLFWLGDASGILIVTPLALVLFQDWRSGTGLPDARWVEACAVGLIFLGVAVLSFSDYLPFAYMIMPPLLWAAVRFEFRGAAVSLTLLAVIAAVFAISGNSQFAGDTGFPGGRQVVLHLFLAVSAFSALVVAAVSRQHQMALLTLSQREQELSQLVDMMPSHVWRLASDGEPTFFNRRMIDYLGFDVAAAARSGIGRLEAMMAGVHPEDAAAFRDSLRQSLAAGRRFSMRYRLRRADGTYRWMASSAEPVRGQGATILQWYGLSTDIDEQVHAEDALRRSERQLKDMVDTLPVRLWSATPGGEPLYFNKRNQDHLRGVVPNFDSVQRPRIEDLATELAHPEDLPEVQTTLRNCFETGSAAVMRFRWREKDGTYRWVECRMEPRRDENGAVAEWYGVSLDIDDERRAQQAVRDRERELAQLVDMLPVYIRRLTPEGEPTFFNKRLTDFIGMSLEEIKAADAGRLEPAVNNYVHPDEAARVVAAIRHAVATGEAYSMKYRMRGREGVYRWIETRAEPLRNQDGTIVQWYSVSIDIDDQMRLYQALEEREGKIRRLVNSDVIGIVFWDLDGRLLEANDAFLRIVQYSREDVQAGLRWLDMTPPEWQDVHARAEVEELAATGRMQPREKEFFRKDGSRVPVLIGAACFEGQSRQGVAYILDLTESKCAEAARMGVEEALRSSQLQLQQLVDTVPVQIWCVTPGGDPAYINRTMVDYIGLKLDDFDAKGGLPSAIETIVHPDDRALLQSTLRHSFETGEPFALKFRNRRWDGVYRWTEGRAEPLRDESGRIVRWYGANVDIDDFVTSQQALSERERFVWQVVETLPAMVDCAAPDGEPIYRNQRLREFLGYDLEALDGTGKSRLAGTLDAGVHPDELEGVKTAYARSLSTGEAYARRHRLRRFDGEYRWVETRAAPMYNAEGATVQWNVICLDIDGEVQAQDNLRLAQDRLSRASQAASLAELSASIAHEVNQPLAAIVANSHACHRWLADTPPNLARAKITAERIIRDANSAADVVSRIRALFKRSTEARSPVALGNVVAEGLGLMADEAARRRVRISTDIENDLPSVRIDRVQILQVFVNLMRNGIEAMEATTDARVLRLRLRRVGDMIQTEISDRGPGIAVPEKIFEPFFTTKAHGMGMGLAVCRSIVEAHHGRLWAERNEPHGATFLFTLPLETKDAP